MWAAARQNQETDPWTQRRLRSTLASAQPGQSRRCALSRNLRTQHFFMRTSKTLIRLDGCPGWSESSLDAHANLLFLSCSGLFVIMSCSSSSKWRTLIKDFVPFSLNPDKMPFRWYFGNSVFWLDLSRILAVILQQLCWKESPFYVRLMPFLLIKHTREGHNSAILYIFMTCSDVTDFDWTCSIKYVTPFDVNAIELIRFSFRPIFGS